MKARPEDFEEVLRLQRDYLQRAGLKSPGEAVAKLEQIHKTSPKFLSAWTLAADILIATFEETRRPEDLQQAIEFAEESKALAPEDPRSLRVLAQIHRASGKVDKLKEAVRELALVEPGASEVLAFRAWILEKENKPEEALPLRRCFLGASASFTDQREVSTFSSESGGRGKFEGQYGARDRAL